jgi:hypothetical protein
MKELIDKAAVVAEIKRLSAYLDSLHEQRIIEKILSFLDTLEVKDVVAEQECICNGILNTIIGDTWHIKIPLSKVGLKHGDKVKIFIIKEK